MPLRLDVKKTLSATSDRVKSVDIHPTEPWVLTALYSGHIFIWNYTNSTLFKSIEVCELPVRIAKFVPRKQWIVCGSDDMFIRVYNYNTTERIKAFEAHQDYIRSLAIHPTLPYVLSASDDMTIKLWDWDKGWDCLQTFEGHSHYVMQVEFNPKDPNTFVSASLDRSIKVWGLNSATPHFSLEGHDRGVNCISYFPGGEKPFLVSGADDSQLKVWDYQTKSCVATLEGHTNNVSSVAFHPHLPIIITGSEDGTVRLWHSTTYRLENTLNYGMERVWALACLPGTNQVAIGYDDGVVMVKLGHEEPVVSMDSTGKIVLAKNSEILGAHVKMVGDSEVTDGERLVIATKEMGACEIYPQYMEHSPNGRFLCVCGDGEYIIYTALALKNKSFGQALEFAWAQDSGSYATRESTSRVKVFKNFKEHKQFRPPFAAEGIFGGALLAVRSNDFVDFYEWEDLRLVRRIAVTPTQIFWSDNGELVVIACESSFYVLRYNRDLVQKYFDQGVEVSDQGIEDGFELEHEIAEKVQTGRFVGDCFIFNTGNRLNYFIGGQVVTLAHLDRTMYVLGYLQKENRVYLTDKQHNIVSYQLLLSVLVYQTAIVRRDFETAERTLSQIPKEQHNKLAHFLDGQDLKEIAFQVSSDPEHKFELALHLHDLKSARDVLLLAESEQKWRQLGDLALADFDLHLAEECFTHADDWSSLLLLHSSTGDVEGMKVLADKAGRAGRFNVAFVANFLMHNVQECIRLLIETNRIPEAAFFTRTYAPSDIPRVVTIWRENLKMVSERASQSLAEPDEYPDLFPDLSHAIAIQQWLVSNDRLIPAFGYSDVKSNIFRHLIDEAKDGSLFADSEPVADALDSDVNDAPVSPVIDAHVPIVEDVVQETFVPVETPAADVVPVTEVVLSENNLGVDFDLDAEVDSLVDGVDTNQPIEDFELDEELEH